MSEAQDREPGGPQWSAAGDLPMPPEPDWIRSERTDEEWVQDWEAWQASLLDLTPPDRFETEFGLPWTPEGAPQPEMVSTEDVAAFTQQAAVQVATVFAVAEAHRVAAVLTAYERAMEDLEVRSDRRIGSRGGLGAQAFFTSMGLQLKAHPRRIAHEVDTALLLPDRLPRTWDVFQRGGSTWARVPLAASHAEGLDPQHWAAFDEAAAGLVVTSHRLKHDLRTKREKLQADTAAARARTTHERRTTFLELGHDGEASLVITGPALALVAHDDALHRAAVAAHGVPGETRTLAMLRHDIALDLLDEGFHPQADPEHTVVRVPERKKVDVTLILTVPALAWLGKTTEHVILGGYGPIVAAFTAAVAAIATTAVGSIDAASSRTRDDREQWWMCFVSAIDCASSDDVEQSELGLRILLDLIRTPWASKEDDQTELAMADLISQGRGRGDGGIGGELRRQALINLEQTKRSAAQKGRSTTSGSEVQKPER